MSELLHKRIEHLRHERETHDRQAAKAVRMQQKLQAQMAAVKEAGSVEAARLLVWKDDDALLSSLPAMRKRVPVRMVGGGGGYATTLPLPWR